MSNNNIEVKLDFDSIKIVFNGSLHLHVKKSKLLGVQSWRYGDNNFFIEYIMDGNTITTEYDDVDKFKFILSKLETML